MMNCNTKRMNNHGHGRGEYNHGCGCHNGGSGFQRSFISPAEEKEKLEKYKDELKKELAGVEEQLKKVTSK